MRAATGNRRHHISMLAHQRTRSVDGDSPSLPSDTRGIAAAAADAAMNVRRVIAMIKSYQHRRY
jgi:hypothetical protein